MTAKYVVYWTERYTDVSVPRSEELTDLLEALKCAEALRRRQFSGEKISHITLMSENPNSVGKPGVDVTGPDYDWKKRRP